MRDLIQFSSFSEFIDMGGYAFNVWSVYLVFALFIAYNLIMPRIQRKQLIRELKRRARKNDSLAANNRDTDQVNRSGEEI